MFTRWTPAYEQEVTDNLYSAADRVAASSLKHLAKAGTDNPAIVDAGVGTGLLAQQVYDALPCRITGLDFTEDMMAACSAREVTELLIKCDVGKDHWPVPGESQDMIMAAGLMEYLTADMLRHFLQEAARVLKKDGFCVFTYLPRQEGERSVSVWPGHSGTYLTCGYMPEEMEDMMRGTGFDIIEHADAFRGCLFQDGSSYDYRLIAATKT